MDWATIFVVILQKKACGIKRATATPNISYVGPSNVEKNHPTNAPKWRLAERFFKNAMDTFLIYIYIVFFNWGYSIWSLLQYLYMFNMCIFRFYLFVKYSGFVHRHAGRYDIFRTKIRAWGVQQASFREKLTWLWQFWHSWSLVVFFVFKVPFQEFPPPPKT